uniref:ribonuclease H n=1 Tax=Gouania willdenowi TaxID=441366 RepID=A0A8C5DIP0_GOUWI
MGTLNAVLKGLARSWWVAARNTINSWIHFKMSFLEAFLPSDYQSEIEEQLQGNVQAPNQCLRDFAYDHRVLCLKWRPDMLEGDIMNRILSACNPRLGSGLRGTVTTVEQLVKVGSLPLHFYVAVTTLKVNQPVIPLLDSQPGALRPLLQKWPTVWPETTGATKVIKHRGVAADEMPVRRRAYRVSREEQTVIEEQIQKMLENNVIKPSTSPWASPVVITPRKDGTPRFCVDYRALNAKTQHDAYPMPLIHKILESLQGAQHFSSLNLQSGYWQLKVMPFAVRNAEAMFQRLMEIVLGDLRGKICFVYIDDIIVFSKTQEQHLHDLEAVFTKLHQANLTLNVKKCHLLQSQLTFLGHLASGKGHARPPPPGSLCLLHLNYEL